MSMISLSARRTELALLLLAVLAGMSSLVLAVIAGEIWFVAVLALAAAPIVIAWRLEPTERERVQR